MVEFWRMPAAPRAAAPLPVLTLLLTALVVGSPVVAETGRVVVAISPPSAETNLYWATPGDFSLQPSMQSLVGHDPETGIYDNSALAESWEANDDFTEWTFQLKPEAEWHFDWGPVTAEDVVHSYELHTQEGAIIIGMGLLQGAEVSADDTHTVTFHLPEPRPNFLFAHGGRGTMLLYSKAQYDAEGIEGYLTRPAGTGLWAYVERRVGEGLVFRRVEDHWSGERTDFEELEIRFVAEPGTKLAMILSGEAHIADLPREVQGDALDAGHNVVASRRPSMHTFFLFNGLYCTTGDEACRPELPWADVRVREAINRAIDREAMLDVLYDGRAGVLAQIAMYEPHEGFVPELVERFEEMYGYDPERARDLLDEAGYPDAFDDPTIPLVMMVLPGNPEFATMTELLQVQLADIGLQAEIREMDFASLGAMGRAREAYLLNPLRNAPIRPTEVGLRNFYATDGTPYAGFEHDTIQALIRDLGDALDPDERHRIAGEAFTWLFETYSDIPIAAIHTELVTNPEVVRDWAFPGVASIGVSHWHLIQAAR